MNRIFARETSGRFQRRLGSRVVKLMIYALAFVLPVLVLNVIIRSSKPPMYPYGPAVAYAGDLPAPPHHDPDRPTVVVLAGNDGTEITDFLGPYSVFSATGAFNVYAVTPERRPAALSGGLDFVPHYSLAEFDTHIGRTPDIVVVPYVPFTTGGTDAALIPWIRQQSEDGALTLSVCAGSQAVAQAGLLEGRRATTNDSWFSLLERAYPGTTWVHDTRYVDDGNIVSSAGITGGIDASLHVVDRLLGRAAAESAAARLGYRHTRFLDDPSYKLPSAGIAVDWTNVLKAFRWEHSTIGAVLYDGLDELSLAAVYETYTNSGDHEVLSLAAERRPFHSRHGLTLLPRTVIGDAPNFDRILVPGTQDPESAGTAVESLLQDAATPVEYMNRSAGAYPYDAPLSDLALRDNVATARQVARLLEYPLDGLTLEGRSWPFDLLVRPLLVGVLGVASMAFILLKATGGVGVGRG